MAKEGSIEFIGSWVLLNCGKLGSYTGQIISVSSEKITITKATQNGKPCPSVYVTFNGEFLEDMKLLDGPPPDVQEGLPTEPPSDTPSKDLKAGPVATSNQVEHHRVVNQSNDRTMAEVKKPNISSNVGDRLKSQGGKADKVKSQGAKSKSHRVTESTIKGQGIRREVQEEKQQPCQGDDLKGQVDNKRSAGQGEGRRDKLRNIPNTVTAYICPVSPPALRHPPRQRQSESSKFSGSPTNWEYSEVLGMKPGQMEGVELKPGSASKADVKAFQPYRRRSYSATSDCVPQDGTNPPGLRNQPPQHHPRKQRNTPRRQREGWLNSDVLQVQKEEFDFEKNLAMFDKAAFYQETDASGRRSKAASGGSGNEDNANNSGQTDSVKPDLVRGVEAKYKCGDSVLVEALKCPPVDSADLISIQGQDTHFCTMQDWLTDEGRHIPVLGDFILRRRLFDTAERYGLSWLKMAENAGRAVAEFIIQQLGGSERLSISNLHQAPRVVLLLGRHKTGALGVAVARHLMAREVNVDLCLPEWAIVEPFCAVFATELQIFKETTGHEQVLRSPQHLINGAPVDFVVSALEEYDSPIVNGDERVSPIVEWCQTIRAPLLAINPPEASTIHYKMAIYLGLPSISSNRMLCRGTQGTFWPHSGRCYLLDMGITKAIYARIGIRYLSPFGTKSIISLHPIR